MWIAYEESSLLRNTRSMHDQRFPREHHAYRFHVNVQRETGRDHQNRYNGERKDISFVHIFCEQDCKHESSVEKYYNLFLIVNPQGFFL